MGVTVKVLALDRMIHTEAFSVHSGTKDGLVTAATSTKDSACSLRKPCWQSHMLLAACGCRSR